MAIQRLINNDTQQESCTQVVINEQDELQCVRVQQDDRDADEIWLFEPSRPLIENELVGKPLDLSLIEGEMVILKFEKSASCLALINDLIIIYGNLVKAEL